MSYHTAVGILCNVSRLRVDDCLDKGPEIVILGEQLVEMGELVSSVAKPLSARNICPLVRKPVSQKGARALDILERKEKACVRNLDSCGIVSASSSSSATHTRYDESQIGIRVKILDSRVQSGGKGVFEKSRQVRILDSRLHILDDFLQAR